MSGKRVLTFTVAGTGFEGREQIIRSRARSGSAVQVRRDLSNQHDRNAIAVHLGYGGIGGFGRTWAHIGFMPANAAANLAPLIDRGEFSVESARVDSLDYRTPPDRPIVVVALAYRRDESRSDGLHAAPRPMHGGESLEVTLESVRWEIAESLEPGDAASLWLRPETDCVHAYARSSVGGSELIGTVVSRRIAQHLREGLPAHATPARRGNAVVVHVELVSREAVEAQKRESLQATAAKLASAYKPKKLTSKIKGVSEPSSDIREGDAMRLIVETPDRWSRNGTTLEFVSDRSGAVVLCKHLTERERIARASLSGFTANAVVERVESTYGGDREGIWKQLSVDLKVVLAKSTELGG